MYYHPSTHIVKCTQRCKFSPQKSSLPTRSGENTVVMRHYEIEISYSNLLIDNR